MVGVSEFLIQKRIQILLDSKFRDLYKILIRGMDKGSIGCLSILFISFIYTLTLPPNVQIHPFFKFMCSLACPAVGTIYAKDLDRPRILPITRSSTDKNDHSASRDHQYKVLDRERDRVNGEFVQRIDRVESANTMDRESIHKVLELAKNDECDVVSAMNVDRLTRAPPFEAFKFYQQLMDYDCILYTESTGYVDWDELNEVQFLHNQTFFARKWYLRIKEGTAGSIISDFEEGKYPRQTPFGFEKEDDHDIYVNEEEREFMYRAFKTYVAVKNRKEVLRRLNERRRKQGKEEISYSQLGTLLESRLCIGQLVHKSGAIFEKPAIQVVDKDTFHKAQEIRRERRPTKSKPDLPNFMARAIDRYGVDHVLSILESFPKRCRKCGDRLRSNGSTTVRGHTLKSYKCRNNDCGHDGPLLTEEEIHQLHHTNPPRCPNCPATGKFDVEDVKGFDEYQYTCLICGHTFKDPLPPEKFQRAMDSPDEKFDMDKEYSLSSEVSIQSESSPEVYSDNKPEDGNQRTLTNFFA